MSSHILYPALARQCVRAAIVLLNEDEHLHLHPSELSAALRWNRDDPNEITHYPASPCQSSNPFRTDAPQNAS